MYHASAGASALLAIAVLRKYVPRNQKTLLLATQPLDSAKIPLHYLHLSTDVIKLNAPVMISAHLVSATLPLLNVLLSQNNAI